MRQLSFTILLALFLTSVFWTTANAQVYRYAVPNAQTSNINLRLNPLQGISGNLNPFLDQSKPDFLSRGYGKEFIASELAILGGSLISGGLFVVGFLFAFSESYAAIPFLIGSGLTVLATPAIAGYFLHLAGRKSHPEGKLGSAILGTYLGTILAVGAGAMLSFSGHGGIFEAFSPLAMAVLPGLGGVLFYNTMPRMGKVNTGGALINSNKGNWSIGFPALSVSPNPFSLRTHFTQLSLMSVKF